MTSFRIPHSAFLVWGVLLAVWVSSAQAAEIRLASVTPKTSTVKLFERFELTATVEGSIANPYDSDEVRLEATFHPPQSGPVTVQGFYYQPYERVVSGGREVIKVSGQPVWKIRFTPRQVGRWSYEVKLVTRSSRQALLPEPFLVVTSSRRGFIQFDREQGSFKFETGQPFIPVGENLCWGPSVQPLRMYEQWFRDLARQRANYIRVWMAPWFLRLETKETGVGRYDQLRAWQLDYLFEQSESAGLFWQLCLLNHGSFSRTQDPDWDNNPYNQALGGMCRLPNDFLTNPHAKAMFRRLLRYMVSRWGYSPQLATWELFNEADYGEFKPEDLVLWLNEMSRFLHGLDVNTRAVTTSFHGEAPAAVWRLPMLDVIQHHMYDQRDFASVFGGPLITKLKQEFGKPVFIGEFGWIEELMRKADDIGIHLHDGIWSSVMGGAYGSALIWYWDSYVHPKHLERHLRALELFLRDERIDKHTKRVEVAVSDPRLAGWGLGSSDRVQLWIKNRAHNVDQYFAYRCELAKQRLAEARGETVAPLPYAPGPVRGATATVQGLKWTGRYRVEWWDPYRGRISQRATTEARRGTVTVEVPDVNFDIAAKLIKLQWWERPGTSP